jgi:hypothetical protein
MKITSRGILRSRCPDKHREYAWITFEKGDRVVDSRSNRPIKIGSGAVTLFLNREFDATRRVKEDGEPLSPWSFVYGSVRFTVDGEEPKSGRPVDSAGDR